MLAPIALFVYNRQEHTCKTIDALRKNYLAPESELFIFSDGAEEATTREVDEVRKYIKSVSGFKEIHVIENEKNIGLANSIISGVTNLVNQYGKVIVLEDDLVTSPYFLSFMNKALDMYEDENAVGSVHGYIYPHTGTLPETFFLKHTSSWGWGTCKRAWDSFEPNGQKLLKEIGQRNLVHEFDFNSSYDFSGMLQRQIDGKNNSWAIRWYASLFLGDKLSLYPGKSLVQNIGQDGSGTHMGASGKYNVVLANREPVVKKIKIEKSEYATEAIAEFFQSMKPSLFERIWNKIKSIIKQ